MLAALRSLYEGPGAPAPPPAPSGGAVLVRSIPRRAQPQFAVPIEWSNPITRSLIFSMGDPSATDLTRNGRPAIYGNARARRGIPQGLATVFASPGDYLAFPNVPAYEVTGQLSIVWGGIFDSVGDGYKTIASKVAPGSGGDNINPFDTYLNTSNGVVTLVRASSGYGIFNSAGAPPAGKLVTLGIMCDADITQTPTMYIDRTLQSMATVAISAASGPAAASGGPLQLGRRSDGSTQLNGSILFCHIFARKITPAEYLSLLANPWQVYPGIVQRFLVPASASTFIYRFAGIPLGALNQ